MVLRRLHSEDDSVSTSPTILDQTTPVSTSSISSTPVFTPSSARLTFEEQRAASPSINSRSELVSRRMSPIPSTASGRSGFTPSSTPSAFGEERVSTSPFENSDDHNPDIPLPSVERDVSSASSRESTSDSSLYTPSSSTHASSTRQGPSEDLTLQQIGDLSNLRLTSPQTREDSSSQQGTPTPSIHITPSATPNGSSIPRASRTDSLVGGVMALRIYSLPVDSSETSASRESRSPSPAHRRRSGSGINRDTHQVEHEAPPQALFHMPEVQEALANARALTLRMTNVLSSSNLHREHGSSIQSLYQQATRLNNFTLPSSRIVGLVGDSGVGKSSLINSLLDKLEVARASSSGTACTCAVTEYLYHDRNDFIIHVDYFSLDELKSQFEELLRAYRDYQLLPRISRGRNEDEDNDDGDRRTLERKASLARETFRASFQEKLEQVPTILTTMPFELAVGKMIEWASRILPPEEGHEAFSTVEGCSTRLRQLTSESDDSFRTGGSRSCWPFIQKLRVYLKAYILSKGLVLADLPGLRDLNSARKAITERYVRQCHQILVVAKIDRAITDESIKDIFDLATRANLSKIDVVCTRSEEIHLREARHDWSEEQAYIEEMQQKIDAETEEIDDLKIEIEDYEHDFSELTREDEQTLLRLQRECRRTEKSKETHKFELLRHIIKLRNEKVSNRLREQYRSHPFATALRTFCVSNKIYWDNREKSATAALPYLDLSGIVELRRYCIGIVAQSRLRATREYIKDEIPAFLGSVELWVEAGSGNGSAERKQQILNAVSAVQLELDKLTSPLSRLNTLSRALISQFKDEVELRMRQSGPQWTADSRQASMYWEGWHHSSYKAFCSNYGEHATNAMGYHCWNEEAIKGMKGDMSAVWDSLMVEFEVQLEQINGAIDQAFGNALQVASSIGAVQPGSVNTSQSAMRTLCRILCNRRDLTLYGFEEASEGFHSDLSSLQTNISSSIRTAFVGKLMENAYHAANMEYGSGSDRRRKGLITGRFSSPSLFVDHQRLSKNMFKNIACGLQDKVNHLVNQQVGHIEADLQLLRDENVVLESERDPSFRRRVKTEVERTIEHMGRIGRVVEDSL